VSRSPGADRPWVETDALEERLDHVGADAETRAFARSLHERGMAVVELGPSAGALCDLAVRDVEPLLTLPGAGRVQDAWRRSDAVRALALHPRIDRLLAPAYGRRPFAFQTLNFRQGSEQDVHADSFHFHSDPPGFMCGVWIALEDVHEDAGPVVYYPGSHRLPVLTPASLGAPPGTDHRTVESLYSQAVRRLLAEQGLRPERALIRKGEAFVWAANLLHGGEPIRTPGATRRSLVVHFYFEGCFYFTPRTSWARPTARLPANIRTGGWVWPRRNGRPAAVAPKFLAEALIRRLTRRLYVLPR
jgi:hypothetical protein